MTTSTPESKQPEPEPAKPMNCIICGHCCEVPWNDAKGRNIPAMHDGIVCFSYGNYGSRLFDMDDGCLRFALCDKCLVKKSKDILYIQYSTKKVVTEHRREPFSEHLKEYFSSSCIQESDNYADLREIKPE